MNGSTPLPSFPPSSPGYAPGAVDAFVGKLIARARSETVEARKTIAAMDHELEEAASVIAAQDAEIATLKRRLEAFEASGKRATSLSVDLDDVIEEIGESPFRPLDEDEALIRAQKAEKAIRGRFLSTGARSS